MLILFACGTRVLQGFTDCADIKVLSQGLIVLRGVWFKMEPHVADAHVFESFEAKKCTANVLQANELPE